MSRTENSSQQTLTPKDQTKIISSIKKLVAERHINVSNPNQDYAPWLALVDERAPQLLAGDRAAFEAGGSELLRVLRSSHTAFFHQRRDNLPPPYSINPPFPSPVPPERKRLMVVDVIGDGLAFSAVVRERWKSGTA